MGAPTFVGETNAAGVQVRETRTYTVVGYYETNRVFEDRPVRSYTALTVADTKQTDGIMYDMYFKMNKASEVYDFMNSYGFVNESNENVLTLSGASRDNSFMKIWIGMQAIIMALIMLGSIALIYNAFSISVSERTKQFGLLSSIGATKKQLRKMVLFEALVISAVGIPLHWRDFPAE